MNVDKQPQNREVCIWLCAGDLGNTGPTVFHEIYMLYAVCSAELNWHFFKQKCKYE